MFMPANSLTAKGRSDDKRGPTIGHQRPGRLARRNAVFFSKVPKDRGALREAGQPLSATKPHKSKLFKLPSKKVRSVKAATKMPTEADIARHSKGLTRSKLIKALKARTFEDLTPRALDGAIRKFFSRDETKKQIAETGSKNLQMSFLIHLYTTQAYQAVNSGLREGIDHPGLQAFTNALTEGMEKMPKFTGEQLHRGIELTEVFGSNYQVGGIVSDPAPLSTSERPDATQAGNCQIVILPAEKTKAVPISNFSAKKEESEVLYPPGAQFRIISRVRGGPDGPNPGAGNAAFHRQLPQPGEENGIVYIVAQEIA